MDTVEELLGVPIDYYAQIDFSAFVRFIDEIGGVKIDVPEKIVVDPLGDNNSKTLKPGRQTLPGDLALAYARARKTEGGDFDRAQRQQQVIKHMVKRQYNEWPNTL
jgi:LCP family protein required for cell wall assembly